VLPILCYHKVGPVSEEGRWLNVEASTLDSHVRFFQRRGREFLRVDGLSGAWPDRAVVLTFDDTYLSAMTHGIEVLRRHSAIATFYVVPAHVGGSSSWDGERERPLADWDLIREAHRDGFEIGNHTMSHPDLSYLNTENQVREWSQADEALRSYGIVPGSACYPYGRLNGESHEALKEAGYTIGVGLAKRQASDKENRLELPRIVVAYSDKLPKLFYKLFVRPHIP